MKINKVAIIGLGYTGLPTLTAIHQTGKHEVVGFDINQEKIKIIKSGKSPIVDSEVEKVISNNNINVSNDENILNGSDVFIICVPTPVFDDYTPDYGPVISASKTVGKYLKKGCHFVLESTVNPGTCEEIVQPILEKESGLKAGKDFNIAHCPERIWPGENKWNIHNINRNIGSLAKNKNKEIADFYREFVNEAKVNEVSSLKVAESTKIVENTFRDINIAYVNELAQSFDSMGIDLVETLQAASNKPFGFMVHWPGCGVGGHCIGVDPYYLIKRASLSGFNHKFLKLAREINNGMPLYTIQKLILGLNAISLPIRDTKIAILGLSYKPNVGDMRESPALIIRSKLQKLGADVVSFDPFINGNGAKKNLNQTIKEAKAIVVCTAHKEIVDGTYSALKGSKVKVIVDGRNCLDKERIEKMNIKYYGIGR